MKKRDNNGQSLIEILIAITIGAILIGAAGVVVVPALKSNLETRTVQVANSLTQDYLDNIQSLAESNWFQIYNPPAAKGPNSQFHLAPTGVTYVIISGSTSTVIENRTIIRYFLIENVNRDSCGVGKISSNATTSDCYPPTIWPGTNNSFAEDPSTQKITSVINWTGGGSTGGSINKILYLTRKQNKVFVQTDWSIGPGQEGPITGTNSGFSSSTKINYSSSTGSIKIDGI